MDKGLKIPAKCPDCGGDVIYYHSSYKAGDGLTRVVCKRKCSGWKVIKEYDHFDGKR